MAPSSPTSNDPESKSAVDLPGQPGSPLQADQYSETAPTTAVARQQEKCATHVFDSTGGVVADMSPEESSPCDTNPHYIRPEQTHRDAGFHR